jgi:DNA topoisomerase-2
MSASIYKKHTHREHILELPDTYIGSTDTHTEKRWVYDSTANKMCHTTVEFNPGFYKLFDEIVVNARDALVRSTTEAGRTPIKNISISLTTGDTLKVVVENDGDGIPIEMHPTEKVWAPELIFGHLLTSGNYKKEEEKIVGGKNGYGAKLTNIFSNTFTVETRSPKNGQKYTQTWSKNMSVVGKPSIKADSSAKGFVKITYEPDLSRFPGFNHEHMLRVLHTRVIELAALAGKDVKVSYNGTTVPVNTFEKFTKLFVKEDSNIAYEKCGERWEIAAVLARNLFDDDGMPEEMHVSFVNGINTRRGGKHVEKAVGVVLGDFCELAGKKKVAIKPAQLKDSVIFFINATIVNPAFDSQTKETLTTPASKFGSVFKTDGKIVTGLMKLGLLDEAIAILDAKANKDVKKTDGSKKKTLRGMPKLVDATLAGTAKSDQCTLILTEGDSAASSAIAGLAVVGRELWGVFPLRGKLLNVRDVSADKFAKNEELTAIKKIIGLEQSKVYSTLKSLRYGRVMVMADQDLDGSHIKGLLMNLFHTEWPTLLKNGFLCSLATPLLKATRRSEVLSFYSNSEFDKWKATNGGTSGWNLKYYKGLGTSTELEAQDWFRNIHEIKYDWDKETDETMSLAFSKKRADDRKSWLSKYDPQRTLTPAKDGHIGYSNFVNDELIHFSNADNIRSLPSLMDGLKPSQRKILFGCFKRGLRSEIRVAQLAGYVSEHASYHHGEASLNGAITAMAQTFVGSNNINLLKPVGQFGTRLLGGKDAASPRYIHTHLEHLTDVIFRKEDSGILEHIDDDGIIVEPVYYYPTVPLLVINGCIGIGTGFSTDIPPHNPDEVVGLLRDRLTGKRETLENIALRPWWLGFKGPIQQVSDGVWLTKGLYTFDDSKHMVSITELPVGTWTQDYKTFLDELCTNTDMDSAKTEDGTPVLKNFDDLYNHIEVRFDLYLDHDYYDDIRSNPQEFEKRFRLTNTYRTSNMVCFDTSSNIVKYNCVGDIMEAYYQGRTKAYEKRRAKEIERLTRDATESDAKARFIKAVISGAIELRNATDEAIIALMKKHSLPPLSKADESDSIDAYEYLLKMRMDRVKASAVIEQEKAVEQSLRAVKLLEATTSSEMWLKDLDEFQATWQTVRTAREEALADVDGKKRSTKKKFTTKSK